MLVVWPQVNDCLRRAGARWFVQCVHSIQPLIARKWHGGFSARFTLGYCAMQPQRSFVSPRGWAMLTLVGGATLASPFLRPPHVDVDSSVTESPLAKTRDPSGMVAAVSYLRTADVDTIADSARSPGQHTGNQLPDFDSVESAPSLPAWAAPRSQLDELISQGAAPAWESESQQAKLQPFQPWMNSNSDSASHSFPTPGAQAAQHRIAPPACQASPWDSIEPDREQPRQRPLSGPHFAAGQHWQQAAPSIPELVPQRRTVPVLTNPHTDPPPSSAANLIGARLSQQSAAPPSQISNSRSAVPRRFVFQPGFTQP